MRDTPPGGHEPPATIRPAIPSDVPQILDMIRELARYEREPDAVIATSPDIDDLLFGGSTTPTGAPAAYCHVVVDPHDADRLVGMALWFLNASTWLGRHGIYLEDLYVRPAARGRGYGQALLATLAGICAERGYGRLEWWVLDWNSPAIDFYRSNGATPMDEWTVHRLTGDSLAALAATRRTPGAGQGE
jgi:GNAT superfamily N-acetyltransferase